MNLNIVMRPDFLFIKAILNKLTPKKFKALAEHARNLNIDTIEKVHGCVNIVLLKVMSYNHTST